MTRIDFTPPADWTRITTIDAHTAGEPFRVVTGGVPEIPGTTILERRRYARKHLDGVRRVLMFEPRGHADMYGCFVVPPSTPGAHLGVLFMHNEGFSTMCGHGIIALTKVALEAGLAAGDAQDDGSVELRIDSPAGLVTARAYLRQDRGREDGGERYVEHVAFRNVPSFVAELDAEVDVPGLGRLRYDLAFGGAFYAYVQAMDAGVGTRPEDVRALIEKGAAIKRAVMDARAIEHPFEDDLGFLYGVIFVDASSSPDAHSRNVCVFADGEVDRSPTGTGVAGRVAIHHARGELALGEAIVIESILGTKFMGRAVEATRFGPYDAVVPEVEGTAHITGRHEFFVDPADELRSGFILR